MLALITMEQMWLIGGMIIVGILMCISFFASVVFVRMAHARLTGKIKLERGDLYGETYVFFSFFAFALTIFFFCVEYACYYSFVTKY